MRSMNIDNLEMMHMRLLAELVAVRSVSLAAQRVGLSQSAASHALAKMRKHLGDPLFTRVGTGIHPTPYGERLGLAAAEALTVIAAGLATNRPFDPLVSARNFNVYMSDIGQMVFLPKFLAHMKDEAPNTAIRSMPIPLINPGASLGTGEVDVAIGFFENLRAGFRQRLLFREHYVCVVSDRQSKFQSGLSLSAFQSAKHAIADSTGMAHSVIDRTLREQRIKRHVVLRVPGYHVLPTIIADTDLMVVMPSRLAIAFASYLPIKILRAPIALPTYDIRIYWHERFHQDPTNRWLRNAFIKLFRAKS